MSTVVEERGEKRREGLRECGDGKEPSSPRKHEGPLSHALKEEETSDLAMNAVARREGGREGGFSFCASAACNEEEEEALKTIAKKGQRSESTQRRRRMANCTLLCRLPTKSQTIVGLAHTALNGPPFAIFQF